MRRAPVEAPSKNMKRKTEVSSPVDWIPSPYDEGECSDRFWSSDPSDVLLPERKGFITDCVYRHRGREIPTLFTIWSTLFVLSSALKREVWLRFGEKPLYTNFYCILVGPPGIAHTTEAIDDALAILEGFRSHIENVEFAFMKTLNLVLDKSAPQDLLQALSPRSKRSMLPEPYKGTDGFYFKDKEGNLLLNPHTAAPMRYSLTAEAAIVSHEFSTLVCPGRDSTGMTDTLLALYDPQRPLAFKAKRKEVVLERLHTTLLAGTTLAELRRVLSSSKRADSFLSSTIIVLCPTSPGRRFSRPRIVPGAPSEEELQRRLAWIVEHSVGQFDLSEEADAYYDQQYREWRDALEEDARYQALKGNFYILVLKVALLLRAQRYETGPKLVDIQDIKDAQRIVEATWKALEPIMRDFDGERAKSQLARLQKFIRSRGEVTRLVLLRNGHFKCRQLNEALAMLIAEGKIAVHGREGERSSPSAGTRETYTWIGERSLDAHETSA